MKKSITQTPWKVCGSFHIITISAPNDFVVANGNIKYSFFCLNFIYNILNRKVLLQEEQGGGLPLLKPSVYGRPSRMGPKG
jgi:hypothetical protein